eukprot:Nitzschia sp. Nitz4//scaffold41_size133979//124279//127172//NITZ4_003373-RA/size133979-processed-gene-0.60-mRNA-1//1//CDS//3329551548//8702//frame0
MIAAKSFLKNKPQSLRQPIQLAFRGLADVEVEHGRGTWKQFGDLSNYKQGNYQIKTFNKISPIGLSRFPDQDYDVVAEETPVAHAILLRSHKLQESDVPPTVRAIARCGAGTNNIPVPRMTELGIPVFNTPGANANAVKELVLCGMFLGSRRVIDGINHMKSLGEQGIARERVEKDKSMFGGQEIAGKTLAVVGLGHIGSMTARDAADLGMKVKGYDPGLSVNSALRLPRELELVDSLEAVVAGADYISINIPYIKGEGGTHGIIGKDVISNFSPNAVLLNFARGELVDSEALKEFLDSGDGRYISDFPDDLLWDHKNSVILPHLGASTEEAEDAAASMAADTIIDYLENGTIKNSVNFPATDLGPRSENTVRFSIVNKNVPGALASIAEAFGEEGLNIKQQINQSRGEIAYNVIDIDTTGQESVVSFKNIQEKITMLEGVVSTRVIFGKPGVGYAKNIDGEYFVNAGDHIKSVSTLPRQVARWHGTTLDMSSNSRNPSELGEAEAEDPRNTQRYSGMRLSLVVNDNKLGEAVARSKQHNKATGDFETTAARIVGFTDDRVREFKVGTSNSTLTDSPPSSGPPTFVFQEIMFGLLTIAVTSLAFGKSTSPFCHDALLLSAPQSIPVSQGGMAIRSDKDALVWATKGFFGGPWTIARLQDEGMTEIR